MGARRIFSRDGQLRGLGAKVTSGSPGIEPRWESGGEASRSGRQVVKIMHK